MSVMSFIWSFFNSAREWICQILACDSSAGKLVKIRGDKNHQMVDSHDNTASNGGTVNITYNTTTSHNYYQAPVTHAEENSIAASPMSSKKEALKEPIEEAREKKTE